MGLFATNNTKDGSKDNGKIHGFPGGWTVQYHRDDFTSSYMSADDAAEACARMVIDLQQQLQQASGKTVDMESLAYQTKKNRLKGPHGKWFNLAKKSDGYWLEK